MSMPLCMRSFIFIYLLFIIYTIYTIHTVKDDALRGFIFSSDLFIVHYLFNIHYTYSEGWCTPGFIFSSIAGARLGRKCKFSFQKPSFRLKHNLIVIKEGTRNRRKIISNNLYMISMRSTKKKSCSSNNLDKYFQEIR